VHVQRIHFDTVFDVQAGHGLFSFTSAGTTTYGVRLPGRVIPREGATWAVAFGRQDDWSTLLGWRDLAAQRTTLNYKLFYWLFEVDQLLWWVAIPALVLCLYFGGVWAALALVVAGTAGVAWRLRHVVRRNRQVRAALRTC
jgi:hypothetical protein